MSAPTSIETAFRLLRLAGALALAGSAMSAVAANTVTVTPSSTFYGATASSITVTVSITYSASLSALDFTMTTPAGAWKVSGVSGANIPQTVPGVDDLGAGGLGFVYSSIPTGNSATFAFTLTYPAGMTGPKVLSCVTNFTDEATSVVSTISPSVTLTLAPTAVAIGTQPTDQTVTQGQTATFTVAATGTSPTYLWKKGTTTLSDTGSVSGSSTATLSIANAQPADEGSYTVTVSNTMPSSVTSTAATLSVNTPASITTQPASQSTVVGTAATFSVVAAGKPASFTYQWKKGGSDISGATSSSYTISSPVLADTGTTYSVAVSNGIGTAVTSTSAILTVNPAPAAPTITTQPQTQTVLAGANVTFTVAATGVPSTFTYTWKKGTAILTDTGNVTGSGTATLQLSSVSAGDAGSYSVTVSNGVGTPATSNTAVLSVNPVLSTTLAVPSKALSVGVAAVTFTPVTAANGTPGYTYAVSPALPAGLAMGTSTGAIAGTPTAVAVVTNYTVTVTDAANATSAKTFSLTVNPAVVATQAVASTTLTAGTAATSFTPVTATGGTAPLAFAVSPSLPAGLAMNPSSGAVTGTAAAASPATSYTVTVTDSLGSAGSKTFSLLVNGTMGTTQLIAIKSLSVGAAAAFTPVAAAGGTAPYAFSVSPALPAGLSINAGSGAISGTPTTATTATTYTVTATDLANALSSQIFSLTVNAAPTSTQGAAFRSVTAGTAVVPFTMMSATGGTAPLTYAITPPLPAGLSLNAATGAVSGTPAAAAAVTTYTVTATDAAGAATSRTFDLTINVAPSATGTVISSKTLTAGTAAIAFTPLTLTGGTPPYAYSVSPALPGGLTLNSGTGTISGTPAAAVISTNYTITGTDAVGAQVGQTLTLVVNGALTATQAIATKALSAGAVAVAFTPIAAGGGTAPYVFSISPPLPAGLAISATTGAISGTPSVASGATTYTVTITDSLNASAGAAFSLTVNPTLTSVQAVATKVLTKDAAAVAFTPVTIAGGTVPMSFAVSPALPAGLSLNPTNGEITGTPSVASAATDYTVTSTDAAGATTSKSFSLIVNAALAALSGQTISTKALTAGAPAVSFTPLPLTGGTTPYVYTVSPALPAGLALNAATGAITGVPTAATALASYTITGTDSAGAFVNQTVSVVVNAALAATQAVPSRVLLVNVAATAFTPVTVTGGTAPFAYAINPVFTNGLAISGSTGAISGTPTDSSAATTFTVTITDSVGASASQTFSLRVDRAAAITTQPVANPSYLVGDSVTLSVVTVGSPAPTYQWRKGGVALTGKTDAQLVFTALQLSDAGTYDVAVSNAVGTVTSSAVTLVVYQLPVITSQPVARSAIPGQSVTFAAVATGSPAPTFQWQRNGVDISGATGASYTIASVVQGNGGLYRVVVTNAGGSVFSESVAFTVVERSLLNLLSRVTVPSRGSVGSGFTIEGATKTILIRAVGPSLTGVTGALVDPRIALLNASFVSIASNDDWSANANAAAIAAAASAVGSSPGLGAGSKDAALLVTLPPGTYTAVVDGIGGAGGLVQLEIVDADTGTWPRVAMLTMRGPVTAAKHLIVGFNVVGSVERDYLIRVLGPSLGYTAGVLVDPIINLYRGSTIGGESSYYNDDWPSISGAEAAVASAGGHPYVLDENYSRYDATLLVSLSPGTYTAEIAPYDPDYQSGEALFEIFNLDGQRPVGISPAITYLARDQKVSTGQTAVFGVATVAKPAATFQWRKYVGGVPTAISGGTSSILTLNNVGAGDFASYDVVISNLVGGVVNTVTSPVRTLSLLPDYHTADTNRDRRLSTAEVTRVVQIYNYRSGATRTGAYHDQAGTEDGFALGPGVLTTYHSADTNRDGRIDSDELLRVIELFDYRNGSVRTGDYHPQSGTEDGFAPGPLPQ